MRPTLAMLATAEGDRSVNLVTILIVLAIVALLVFIFTRFRH